MLNTGPYKHLKAPTRPRSSPTSAQPERSACPRSRAAWLSASPPEAWRSRPGKSDPRLQKSAASAGRSHQGPHLVVSLQQPLVVCDVLHLVQEPAVDLGELVQLVHRVARPEGRGQDEDALVCRRLQLLGDKSRFLYPLNGTLLEKELRLLVYSTAIPSCSLPFQTQV